MGPDSRHGPCLHCSPVFGGGLGTPSLQGAERPCGHFHLSPHPPRSWRCRSGPGQQGSAPSSAQLDPFSWAPIPFGGTRSCHRQPGRSGWSPGTWLMPVRAPVSAAAAWCEAVPTAPCGGSQAARRRWTEDHSWPWGSRPRETVRWHVARGMSAIGHLCAPKCAATPRCRGCRREAAEPWPRLGLCPQVSCPSLTLTRAGGGGWLRGAGARTGSGPRGPIKLKRPLTSGDLKCF